MLFKNSKGPYWTAQCGPHISPVQGEHTALINSDICLCTIPNYSHSTLLCKTSEIWNHVWNFTAFLNMNPLQRVNKSLVWKTRKQTNMRVYIMLYDLQIIWCALMKLQSCFASDWSNKVTQISHNVYCGHLEMSWCRILLILKSNLS